MVIKAEVNLYAGILVDESVPETDAIIIGAALARENSSSRCGLNDLQKKIFTQHKETLERLRHWKPDYKVKGENS